MVSDKEELGGADVINPRALSALVGTVCCCSPSLFRPSSVSDTLSSHLSSLICSYCLRIHPHCRPDTELDIPPTETDLPDLLQACKSTF